MATRATYEFVQGFLDQHIYIYNHWDGYPKGAAEHLKNATTAESFLRKNEGSEITSSHCIHGDTEYRYVINSKNKTIIVFEREYPDGWNEIFDDTFEAFLKEYN
tara:strand:- start:722 stop:1033 length:312 start_codon:yes stop_codon:yes gene_type:complete